MLEELSLKLITNLDQPPFFYLHQFYEFEFSPITDYEVNEKGLYCQESLRKSWREDFAVYLLCKQTIPIGFAVINLCSYISGDQNTRDVAEFFVMPRHRNKAIGNFMAKQLFDLYPGKWEIRQLNDATKARGFWLKVIDEYTHGKFIEEKMDKGKWIGYVQSFMTDAK